MKEDEILICEITQTGTVPRYRLVKGDSLTSLYYADSPNITQLNYPFQILSWALPILLDTSYRDRKGIRSLEIPTQALENFFGKLVRGRIFSSNRGLERRLMARYARDFREEYRKMYGKMF